jgi:hypothetical protein
VYCQRICMLELATAQKWIASFHLLYKLRWIAVITVIHHHWLSSHYISLLSSVISSDPL